MVERGRDRLSPFTESATAAFDRAEAYALEFGHGSVSVKHFLLGLLPDHEVQAVFAELGVEVDQVRATLMDWISQDDTQNIYTGRRVDLTDQVQRYLARLVDEPLKGAVKIAQESDPRANLPQYERLSDSAHKHIKHHLFEEVKARYRAPDTHHLGMEEETDGTVVM